MKKKSIKLPSSAEILIKLAKSGNDDAKKAIVDGFSETFFRVPHDDGYNGGRMVTLSWIDCLGLSNEVELAKELLMVRKEAGAPPPDLDDIYLKRAPLLKTFLESQVLFDYLELSEAQSWFDGSQAESLLWAQRVLESKELEDLPAKVRFFNALSSTEGLERQKEFLPLAKKYPKRMKANIAFEYEFGLPGWSGYLTETLFQDDQKDVFIEKATFWREEVMPLLVVKNSQKEFASYLNNTFCELFGSRDASYDFFVDGFLEKYEKMTGFPIKESLEGLKEEDKGILVERWLEGFERPNVSKKEEAQLLQVYGYLDKGLLSKAFQERLNDLDAESGAHLQSKFLTFGNQEALGNKPGKKKTL